MFSVINASVAETIATHKAPFWGKDPSSWDSPVFGDGSSAITVPGYTVVSGVGVAKLERRRSPGKDGENISYLGADPISADFTVYVWTEEQLTGLQKLINLLIPSKGPRKPVRISYPALAMFNVTHLFLQEISLLSDTSGQKGVKQISMKFIQFFPPADAKGAGQVSKAGNVDSASIDKNAQTGQSEYYNQWEVDAYKLRGRSVAP